ncbi:hypothetical protein Fcan01_25912 [Folsomia candida]|uniref:Uncharacterized protein n=1 Tax=Folsomia candida TaxID=158441 RepID=A0A226D505_FOLCA|nr:hypothetical protein Fcan01_25912 [Folsomia candida]
MSSLAWPQQGLPRDGAEDLLLNPFGILLEFSKIIELNHGDCEKVTTSNEQEILYATNYVSQEFIDCDMSPSDIKDDDAAQNEATSDPDPDFVLESPPKRNKKDDLQVSMIRKKEIIGMSDAHPSWNWKTLKRHGAKEIPNQETLCRWRQQETGGKLGPKVKNDVESYLPSNVTLACSTSGKLSTSLNEYFVEKQVVPHVTKDFLYIVDSWPGQTNIDSYSKFFGKVNGRPEINLKVIPEKCTPLAQPLDTTFHRQLKYLAREILAGLEVFLNANGIHQHDNWNTRKGVLKLQSILHLMISAPIFQPMIRYAWFSSGLSTEKPDFLNVKQACFTFADGDSHILLDPINPVLGLTNPNTPNSKNTDTPNSKNPDTPNSKNPDTPNSKNPDTPNSKNPDTPNSKNPDTPNSKNPDFSDFGYFEIRISFRDESEFP